MNRTRLRSTTAALAVLAVVSVTHPNGIVAQADSTRTDSLIYRLDGISVSAQRPVTIVGGVSAIEVDISQLVLPPAATTAELLKEIRGVHVRTNSRGQAEISVRGSESRQVAVLLDGVPLTLSYDARTDLSVLPATALDDVTFVRGLSTLLHGPNVLGGVVEMSVAGEIPYERSMSVSGGVDHVGGYSTAASGTFPFEMAGGRGMVRLGAGFRDSPGLTLPSGVTEPVPTDDDLRLNTDYRNRDGFLAFRYESDSGAWTSLSATTHEGYRGIAAELGADEPRLWRYPDVKRTIVALAAGTGELETPFGEGDVEVSAGYDDGVTNVRSFGSRAYDVIDGFENGDDRTLTLRLLADHSLGDRGQFRTSFTHADIRHDENADGDEREFEQKLTSLAAETVWRLLREPTGAFSSVNLSLGAAYDRATTPLTGGLESLPTIDDWGARIGLQALVNDGNTMLHVGASRRGRFPSLRETYSEALNRFVPNPDLSSEHLVALEGGVTTRVGTGELQVVAFRHSLTDAIRRISLPDRKRMRVNSDELTSYGVELYFSQTLGTIDVGGEVTLQSVELTDPSNGMNINPENVPERAGTAFVTVPLADRLSATLEAEYTGPQFCIHPNTGADVELDGGSWFNAVLSKVFDFGSRGAEVSVSGVNLANEAIYDSCGLPRAGRLFRMQMRVF